MWDFDGPQNIWVRELGLGLPPVTEVKCLLLLLHRTGARVSSVPGSTLRRGLDGEGPGPRQSRRRALPGPTTPVSTERGARRNRTRTGFRTLRGPDYVCHYLDHLRKCSLGPCGRRGTRAGYRTAKDGGAVPGTSGDDVWGRTGGLSEG